MPHPEHPFVFPDWPAPDHVRAVTTTRRHPDGVDASFNLATHVKDDPDQVIRNRSALKRQLELSAEPCWLRQVHGRKVVRFDQPQPDTVEADAGLTTVPGLACVVLTADCLPVLLCDRAGSVVAAVHAGWRGLQQNIIAETIHDMAVQPENLLAWLGPAISAQAYEVDDGVYSRFDRQRYGGAFQPTRPGHWSLDLCTIARYQLDGAGVQAVYGGGYCTFRQNDLFFSYRRENETGRMASLIWMTA